MSYLYPLCFLLTKLYHKPLYSKITALGKTSTLSRINFKFFKVCNLIIPQKNKNSTFIIIKYSAKAITTLTELFGTMWASASTIFNFMIPLLNGTSRRRPLHCLQPIVPFRAYFRQICRSLLSGHQ